jgi:hypothetical protein
MVEITQSVRLLNSQPSDMHSQPSDMNSQPSDMHSGKKPQQFVRNSQLFAHLRHGKLDDVSCCRYEYFGALADVKALWVTALPLEHFLQMTLETSSIIRNANDQATCTTLLSGDVTF